MDNSSACLESRHPSTERGQHQHFGRVYAAYGGVFVVLSILWGWWVDGVRPDRPEVVGPVLCLIGVSVIMYWPRG